MMKKSTKSGLKSLIPLSYIVWWLVTLNIYIAPILDRELGLFSTTMSEIVIVLMFFLFGLPFVLFSAVAIAVILSEERD